MDLRLTHERFGNSFNPSFNDNLHYPAPADIDNPLNEAAAAKIRDYRADYYICLSDSISFMSVVASTSGRLQFRFRRAAFYSQLKSKVGNSLTKATVLRINLRAHLSLCDTNSPLPLTNLS